ncbi:preprotein translocase subunit SecE [Rhodoferax sp. 4810]|uniref:Protein translocase subunit SecE n=1 Tax=Thiospirillum jenense TaxID=1653858 RepID=A0A839HCR5_9GAMM|nr:preprotein translocase subunit SecE [Thiospirillum jenense]MBB1073039.1 preprotein translocase subunit SecE [Rhodoferax jenense]MBB1124987.1 preprotein translocase subunit SecE [Thiospirillum jenense]
MNIRAETGETSLDTVKLVAAIMVVIIGIWGFYFFADYSLLLRVVALLVFASGATALALTTEIGQQMWRFAVDARVEVRKVIWPTRQETFQTTLIVSIMVLILGVLLWLFDMMLMAILRLLTGHGG